MGNVIIRKAEIKDLEMLLIFEQGVIYPERPFDPTLNKSHIHYYDIKKLIASDEVELLVAELNNELVGSGYARIENARHYLNHAKYAYLGFMYVIPAERGKGINKLIIDALADWALTKNITELRLDVYQINDAAIKAYESAGFSKHMINMRKGL